MFKRFYNYCNLYFMVRDNIFILIISFIFLLITVSVSTAQCLKTWTTQADWDSGIRTNTDTISNPGDVKLSYTDIVDQDDSGATFYESIMHVGTYPRKYSQGFIAGHGYLSKVRLWIRKQGNPSTNYYIAIYNADASNKPAGSPLYSTSISSDVITTLKTAYDIPIGIPVTVGNKYALVFWGGELPPDNYFFYYSEDNAYDGLHDINEELNLALASNGGIAIANSCENNDCDAFLPLLNDGNHSTRWIKLPATSLPVYFGVRWDTPKTFNKITFAGVNL